MSGAPPWKLLIDPLEYRDAEHQILSRERGENVPMRFPGILSDMASVTLAPVEASTLMRTGAGAMAWHLRPSTLAAAIAGRLRAYLCWGVAHHRGWRRMVARYVLRSAHAVLVNDEHTAKEVLSLSGVRPHNVPYLVDTDFFAYAPPGGREDYLFCPSSNDRNGDVLLALARAGREIVWMNNDERHHALYGGRHENLTLVRGISYAELRGHYGHAAAVVLPLARDVHAAGQTTALEAIASGAPIVISAGRTSELLRDRGLLTVMADNRPDAWSDALDRAVRHNRADPVPGRDHAYAVARTNGPAAFLAALRPFVEGGA